MCRIPVYVINTLYIWPITIWTYLNYGRPKKPSKTEGSTQPSCHAGHGSSAQQEDASPSGDRMGNCSPGSHGAAEEQHYHHSPERPMFATITVAVCHCGAGCVLGDIIGEWLVYGTGAKINGKLLWVEFLVGKFVETLLQSTWPQKRCGCFPRFWRMPLCASQGGFLFS